jgi:hypothetical protein
MQELGIETLDKLEDFLSTIPSKYTRKNYRAEIKRFEDWYGQSITTLMKSMERGYCCLTELESKGLFSTCSKFIMFLGESIDVRPKKSIFHLT